MKIMLKVHIMSILNLRRHIVNSFSGNFMYNLKYFLTLITTINLSISDFFLFLIYYETLLVNAVVVLIELIYYLFNQELFIDTINENFELYKNMPLEFYF